MRKLRGLVRLMRLELPFSAGVCVVMGQLLALGRFSSVYRTAGGFFSIFCILASILVLNDYFDVETDRINAPHRPIPSNAVTPSEALWFALFLLVAGLVLSSLIGLTALVCSAVLSVVGFLYNRRFKKSGLPGNLMVSFSVGMTFIYGGISVGLPYSVTALFFGVIAALVDLGEEIAADSMDIEGDRLIDSRSLAITYGKRVALTVSGCIFSTVIVLTIVPFALRWIPSAYLPPIILMDTAIAYSTYKLLTTQDSEQEGRKHIRHLYLGATLGLVVFLIMRVVGV